MTVRGPSFIQIHQRKIRKVKVKNVNKVKESHLSSLKSSLRHDWSTYMVLIPLVHHVKPEGIIHIISHHYNVNMHKTPSTVTQVMSN